MLWCGSVNSFAEHPGRRTKDSAQRPLCSPIVSKTPFYLCSVTTSPSKLLLSTGISVQTHAKTLSPSITAALAQVPRIALT
jgi:hypothetical protein